MSSIIDLVNQYSDLSKENNQLVVENSEYKLNKSSPALITLENQLKAATTKAVVITTLNEMIKEIKNIIEKNNEKIHKKKCDKCDSWTCICVHREMFEIKKVSSRPTFLRSWSPRVRKMPRPYVVGSPLVFASPRRVLPARILSPIVPIGRHPFIRF